MTGISKQSVELLLEMVDDLENFKFPPNSKFDMSHWGEHKEGHHPKEQNYCGTSACAIGWLSTMPKWQERGIKGRWVLFCGEYDLEPAEGGDWSNIACKVFHVSYRSVSFLFANLTSQDLPGFCRKVRRFVELRKKGYTVNAACELITEEYNEQ